MTGVVFFNIKINGWYLKLFVEQGLVNFRGRTYDEMFMGLARTGCAQYTSAKVIVTDMLDNSHQETFERGHFRKLNSSGPLTEAMGYFCSQTAQKKGVSRTNSSITLQCLLFKFSILLYIP